MAHSRRRPRQRQRIIVRGRLQRTSATKSAVTGLMQRNKKRVFAGRELPRARSADKAEQAYRRSDALDKRRKLMEAWATYCEPKRLRHRRANAQTKMDRGRVFIIRIGKRAQLHAETDRTATSGGLSLGTMNALHRSSSSFRNRPICFLRLFKAGRASF
jgi:hypothetical protein